MPPVTVSAQLSGHVTLEAKADGAIAACFEGGYSTALGKFSTGAAARAESLRTGVPLGELASDSTAVGREMDTLIRRLALRGLVEYHLRDSRGKDQVIIEPQVPAYWPQQPQLRNTDRIVLSRFAYLRRRGNEIVLESPRAGALFRMCDPRIATALASLSTPQKISKLRQQDSFPGIELFAILLDCQILFKLDADSGDNLRAAEGGSNLLLWDFHDLLFHTHSTEGRQANPLGGLYPYAGVVPPPPAVRPRWPGKEIDLRKLSDASETISPVAKLLHARHSTRDFNDRQPITLAELALLLDQTARVKSKWKLRLDFGEGNPEVDYTSRPYPTGGSSYELELYLTVSNCEGLERGFYHYDAGGHALMPIAVGAKELDAQLAAAAFAMDASGAPQILITIAARFDRTTWKYSSIAYSLVLKDVGVLTQTLYMTATDIGLGGCAIGSVNIDLFAKMTGLKFYVEGPVGLFALGRGMKPQGSG